MKKSNIKTNFKGRKNQLFGFSKKDFEKLDSKKLGNLIEKDSKSKENDKFIESILSESLESNFTESNANLDSKIDSKIVAKVAIIGRPNVGKSSLFNRIIKKNIAITSSLSGSTRDINKQNVALNRFCITLIDTGGLDIDLKTLKKLSESKIKKPKSSKKNNLDSINLSGQDSIKNTESKLQNITLNTNLSNKKSQTLIAKALKQSISAHSFNVIESSDIIIYLLDGSTPASENDLQIFRTLSKKAPVILAINKIDNDKKALEIYDEMSGFSHFGVEFVEISVSHNRGITKLLEKLENLIESRLVNSKNDNLDSKNLQEKAKDSKIQNLKPKELDFMDYFDENNSIIEYESTATHADSNEDSIKDNSEENTESKIINIGIIGRPNVGKSSLLNALSAKNRSLVSNIPGTTIDPVNECIAHNGYMLNFVDTAGLRRRGKIEGIEKFALDRTQKVLRECDIAILLLDSSSDFSALDSHISSLANNHHLGIIVALSKWDIKNADFDAKMTAYKHKFKFLEYAPLITISARTHRHISTLKDKIIEVYKNFCFRIPTATLNECVQNALKKHPLPSAQGKIVRIYYATQFGTKPPQIALIMNKPDALHFSYKRYLINTLRENFNFQGTPIIIESKSKKLQNS